MSQKVTFQVHLFGLAVLFFNGFWGLPGFAAKESSAPALIRYMSAQPQSNYPRGLRVSPRYRVLAQPAARNAAWNPDTHATAVYEAWPDYLEPQNVPDAYENISVHFAQVDTDQRIRFRIETLGNLTIETLNVNPSRYTRMRQTLQHGKRWIEFEVDPSDLTKHVLVEINESEDSPVLNHGLMIFVNPLTPKPEGKVLELPSGVVSTEHPAVSEDRCLHIAPDSPYDALYLPADTILDGRIQIHKPGFTVTGRGIVCGSSWKHAKSQRNWGRDYPITQDREVVKGICSGFGDTTFEGILTVHPYHFNFTDGLHYINLKAFGWRYSSDGFHGKYIRGCFAKVNDDAQYTNEGIVERCSYWGMNNGGIFQLGWGGAAIARGGGCHVKSCNVLRNEWTADGGRQNNGVFSGVISARGLLQDTLFEDIRVDGQCFRFIGYSLESGAALKDFTFKDIWFEKPLGIPQGRQKAGKPHDNYLVVGAGSEGFVFENVVIGDKKVTCLEDFGPIQTKNLEEITFK